MNSGTPPSVRYRSVHHLAEGGMGEVEIAIREEGAFRRTYAIKRLRASYANDAEIRAMFLDEARVAGLINHPNVVGVVDFGEDDRGPFLVMDYVEGMSLARLISWTREHGEMLPVQLCCRVVRQIAEGLHAAHELRNHRGKSLELVHRDVSPQNILISYDGVARLTDFGIARATGRRAQTESGVLKGKMGYMSPEQLRFERADRRSDLFSLGVVFYEMLAGERLYAADTSGAVAQRVLHEAPPDIDEKRKDVPPSLVDLLMRLLTKERESRPESAREVAAALERVIADLLDNEPPTELGEYMREHFEQERALKRQEMERLFQKAAPPVQEVVAERPKPTGLMVLAGLGIVAGIGFALAGLYAFGVIGGAVVLDGNENASGSESSNVVQPELPEPIPAPDPARVATADAGAPPDATVGTEMGAASPTPPAMDRRRNTRRRSKMSDSVMDDELWRWNR